MILYSPLTPKRGLRGKMDIAGSLINAGANLLGNVFGIYSADKQNTRNLNFQKEVFEYQKGLNQTMMEREDSSYQRKMADMQRAGLNPVLAAGGAGATSHPGTAPTAPKSEMDYTMMQDMVLRMGQMAADISRTKAEAERLRKQSEVDDRRLDLEKWKAERDHEFREKELGISGMRADTESKAQQSLASLQRHQEGHMTDQQLTASLQRQGMDIDRQRDIIKKYEELHNAFRNISLGGSQRNPGMLGTLWHWIESFARSATGDTIVDDRVLYSMLTELGIRHGVWGPNDVPKMEEFKNSANAANAAPAKVAPSGQAPTPKKSYGRSVPRIKPGTATGGRH